MKTKFKREFWLGIVLILCSYIPFSYMNHSDKFKPENCIQVEGAVTEVTELYRKGGGWSIQLAGVDYKIRIVGEYYEALDKELFNRYIKKGNMASVYILKPENYGIFEKLNSNMQIRDAAGINSFGYDVLSMQKIRAELKHLFVMNLIFGLAAAGTGLYFLFKSLR